ncbi:TPA: ABC transporter ATP-binding protein [Pseudomonas aeruginosa]
MSSDIAIKVDSLSKCYQIYEQPRDRLKQFLLPKAQRLIGMSPRKYYREFWALRDVSFEVRKGETVGIIGCNGSGKSTLLQMICGTLNPSSGNIVTNGRIAALLELGSGFNPEFSGRENVYLNSAILGLSKEEVDARFDDIVTFADIGEFIDQPIKTYSSGMMVRLAFSVAINIEPEILIVDEALSVGDELFQRKCFSRIEAIRAAGATIIFVSHSAQQIIELCNHAIMVDAGEKISMGAPRDVVSSYLKLLYSPIDKKTDIRTEIARKFSAEDSRAPKTPLSINDFTAEVNEEMEETFDPDLSPSSTIEYESHGPVIGLPVILTASGERVNGLIRGRRYRYCYRVAFHQTGVQVRFGMSIKSTTGFSLCGALSAPSLSEAIPLIEQGRSVDVEFTFDCSLNPGIYFFNAGVFGVKDGDEVVLHRRSDVIAFRVLPVSDNFETEIVSLDVQPRVLLDV